MIHPSIAAITDDQFLARLDRISNVHAIYRSLRGSHEVDRVRTALSQGEIDDTSEREFVSKLLRAFRAGQLFPYDLSLAAVAVAIEHRSTAFTENFLRELAGLELREMPIAIRAARQALAFRSKQSANRFATYTFAATTAILPTWQNVVARRSASVSQTVKTVQWE